MPLEGVPDMADPEDTPADETDAGTATADEAKEETQEKEPVKLRQTVDIRDIGPCKKHITVTINREDIDARLDDKYSELVTGHQSLVAGFRPGKAPRKIVERFYREEVTQQVRGELLMASAEQIAEDQDFAPLP